VGEGDGGRHRDHVAAVERELHPGATLGDPVAHRGHGPRHLRDATRADGRPLEHGRVLPERLVRREHVVVAGDDGEVRLGAPAQRLLGRSVRGGEAVGQVGAGEAAPGRAGVGRDLGAGEVRRPGLPTPPGDSRGDVRDDGVDRVHWSSSCQVRPSRSRSVAAAVGPLVPAG
jgi:hypothetical protein